MVSVDLSTMAYKHFILVSVLLGSVFGFDDPRVARIVDYQLEQSGTGPYFFQFETSDGITRQEEGALLDAHIPDSPIVVKGSYSYPDETGKLYTVRYIADENGFHPEGDHISVPKYVIDPNPVNQVNQIVVPSTQRPPVQLIQSTLRPQFVPDTPSKFQLNQINSFSTTPQPDSPTKVSISLDNLSSRGVTQKPTSFNELDTKLQNSIVGLLSSGEPRGFKRRTSN